MFGISLRELIGWVETAYFREVRAQGLTLKESGKALGISQRTAVRLSKQLREAFFLPETSHHLGRRIEFMLATRPMGMARIRQVLPEAEANAVDEAVVVLLREGRLREVKGRTLMFESVAELSRLPRDTWLTRVGALNSFVENLANVAYGRFFRLEERSFARTLSFFMLPDDQDQLGEIYEEVLLPRVRAISKHAEDDETAESMQMSLCWAPYEYLEKQRGGS